MNLNDVLMGRVKRTAPVKRKRTASSAAKEPAGKRTHTAKRSATEREPESELKTSTSGWLFGTPKKAAGATQSYIDVGQKSFGKHTTCRLCGLLYTIGEEEDEKQHQQFCKRAQQGISIPKWKNERLLRSFPEANGRIIEIRAADPASHVSKLMEVKALLDDALGAVDESEFLQRSSYLYLSSDRQVVGCVTVERIEKAYPFDSIASSSTNSSSPKDEDKDRSEAAVVGICQLWVHASHRKQRIATRLIDTVCDKFIYGMHVSKRQLAFAQPTANGLAFAKSYGAHLAY